MTKPTEKEIKAEIAALRKMKPTVLTQSVFGENHHHAIERQISVLEDLGRFFDEEEIEAIADEDHEDWAENERDAALEAWRWTEGQSEDGKPSDGWKSLVRK